MQDENDNAKLLMEFNQIKLSTNQSGFMFTQLGRFTDMSLNIGCQLDEPYGMQHCFNVFIDIYHGFLLLFYCCVLLEIKFTTTVQGIHG